jgi:hypothetical protein
MKSRLIVSAYRGRAKMYLEANGCGNFDEVHDVVAAADEEAADDETSEKLASCVAGYVKQAHLVGMFDELIVVAPQKLLHRLGDRIGEQPTPRRMYSAEEDRTRMTPHALCEWLRGQAA